MSKLYNTYLSLKKQDADTIYFFKSGIFYIALDADANTLSSIFNLKLGKLTDTITKCGFPRSSLEKYLCLFKSHNLKTKFVELNSNTVYRFEDYKQNEATLEFLKLLSSIDINNLSVSEAYTLLDKLKQKAIDIINIGG